MILNLIHTILALDNIEVDKLKAALKLTMKNNLEEI